MEILSIAQMARLKVTKEEQSRIFEQTVLMRKKHVGEDEPQYTSEISGDDILVPRSHPMILKGGKVKPLSRARWKDFQGFTMLSILREPQQVLVNNYLSAIEEETPLGGIVGAPTGMGKTVMGISLAATLRMPTLVVVPRAALVEQWIERFKEHTNLKEEEIGTVRQGLCEFRGKKVVIGLVHSLAQRKYHDSLYSAFGLVIFDEVHTMGAETFSRVTKKFNSELRLGLSATTLRKDGTSNLYFWNIGPIITRTFVHDVKPKIVQIQYYNQATGHLGFYWKGRLNFPGYLNRLAACPARNTFVAGIVKALYDKGHHILLLSDRLNILHHLRNILNQEVGTGKVGLFTNADKDLTKQILLGTYGSADLGADIPRLSALVLATPRVDVVQAIGRVLRQGEPIVVDIVDTASSVMQGWAYARQRLYRNKGWSYQKKSYRAG